MAVRTKLCWLLLCCPSLSKASNPADPTTPPPPRIAIAAHSAKPREDYPLDLLLDGDTTSPQNYAALGAPPQSVTFELSPPQRVERIGVFYLGRFGGRKDFGARWRVDVSVDGKQWDTVAEETRWRHNAVYEKLNRNGVRFVRVTVTDVEHEFDRGVYLREVWVNEPNQSRRTEILSPSSLSQHYRHFQTALTGPVAAKLVLPHEPEQRAVAEALQRALAARGVDLPVLNGAAVTDDVLRDNNLIVLGNLATNRFVQRLYHEYYCFVDRWYPGREGFVVQTIHDPYGQGRNIVLLGASDTGGLRRAVKRFLALIRDDGVVPRTFDVELGADLKALRKRRGEGPRSLVLPWRQNVFGSGNRAGYEYLFTGDEAAAEEFKRMMLDPATQFNHLSFFHKIVQWDLLEESPVFSDDDRRRISERILRVLLSAEGARNGGFLEALRRVEPRQNHQTRVALILFFGGRYFRKYHDLPQAERWMEQVEAFFRPQATCSKAMSDNNADQWQGAIDNMAIYALASGNMEFFAGSMMRLAADRAAMNCNNLGEIVPLGDAWQTYYPVTVLSKAAYYYRDGRYQAWLQRRGPLAPAVVSDDPMRSFAVGVVAQEPTGWTGFTRAPLQPLYYDFVAGANRRVPLERAFDKIAFRSGLKPDDLYFLLDGASGGSHAYDDANSLIEVSQHGRVYLTTLDNLTGPSYADHNAVTVTRDGRGSRPPALAELEAMKKTGVWNYLRTTVRDYEGADWTRRIWTRRGEYLLVADKLTARVPGDFVFIARWRTLGTPSLVNAGDPTRKRQSPAAGPALHSVQAPRDGSSGRRDTFVIQTLPGPIVSFHVDEQAIGKAPLRNYAYAPMAVNVLRQILARRLLAGQSVTFWNLLHATPGGDPDPAKMLRAAPGGVVVEGWGAPLFFSLDAEQPAPVRATRPARRPRPAKTSDEWTRVPTAPVRELWRFTAPTPVSAMRIWSEPSALAGENPTHRRSRIKTVFGTRRGEVIVVDSRGNVEWRRQARDQVMSVDAADVDGDGQVEIVAGSDDGRVFLFDRDGKTRWTFAPPFENTGYNWWTLGASKVRRVRAADLDGDGRAEILAGVGNMKLHVLDSDGRPQWEFLTHYGVFDNFMAADCNGDGRLEIIGGTDGLSCLSQCRVINAAGKQELLLENDGWVSSLSALLPLRLPNVETTTSAAKGTTDPRTHSFGLSPGFFIICGTDLGNVRAFGAPRGERLWQHNIGDGVTVLAIRRADAGDREPRMAQILAGSESCQVCAFSPLGKRLWHTRLPDRVTVLTVLRDGRILAGDATIGLWWLDSEGRIVARAPVPGGVSDVEQTATGELLVRSGTGEVRLLSETR